MSWQQSTYEKGNSQTCSTRLKSNLIIRKDGHGAALPTTTKDGITTYSDIQPGYAIEWSAKTESDGSGKSDRVTARLVRLNTVYLGSLINDATSTNPNASQDELISIIVEMADPGQLMSIVSSQTVCSAAVGAVGLSGGAAAPVAAFGCSLAISMAVAFCRMGAQYAKDAFGLIDTNKHGCTFPIGGHNHTYAIAIGGDAGALEASAAAGLTTAATESGLAKRQFPIGKVIIGSFIAASAVLLIYSSLGDAS